MTTTMQYTGQLAIEVCCSCAISFAMPTDYQRRRRDDHELFYCPVGHPQHYTGATEVERLKRLNESAERRVRLAQQSERFYRDLARTERRSAAAHKGHVTRIRNLVAKGICPVAGCRRNFTNVREHMATQHPDFHTHEDGAS